MALPALYLYTRPFVSSPVYPMWDDIVSTNLGQPLSSTPTGNNLSIDLVSALLSSWPSQIDGKAEKLIVYGIKAMPRNSTALVCYHAFLYSVLLLAIENFGLPFTDSAL